MVKVESIVSGKKFKGVLDVKEKAGLPKDFRPLHGLRHTFASWLASSGAVDLYTLQKHLRAQSGFALHLKRATSGAH